jgi:hypothetical protein
MRKFSSGNIKLVVAESGENLVKGLFRFSVLSQGSHYFTSFWQSSAFFTPINTEILNDCENGLKTERRMVRGPLLLYFTFNLHLKHKRALTRSFKDPLILCIDIK